MSDVTLFALSAFLGEIDRSGLPPDAALARTSLDPRQVQGVMRGRCSWNDFATVIENATDYLGGVDEIERLGRAMGEDPPSMLVGIVRRFVRMHTLYYLGANWFGPLHFRGIKAIHTDLPDGVIQSLRLAPSHRVSVPIYHIFKGALAGAPRMMGWSDAEVEMTYQGRDVAYRIHLTPPDATDAFDRDSIAHERSLAESYIEEFDAVAPGAMDPLAAPGGEAKGDPLVQRVCWLLEASPYGEQLTANRAARQLGMSERSLARGLSREGTTFSGLKDAIRQRRAIALLARGERIEDVAGTLGFADPSSFHRAFRRWTGRSPGSYQPDS